MNLKGWCNELVMEICSLYSASTRRFVVCTVLLPAGLCASCRKLHVRRRNIYVSFVSRLHYAMIGWRDRWVELHFEYNTERTTHSVNSPWRKWDRTCTIALTIIRTLTRNPLEASENNWKQWWLKFKEQKVPHLKTLASTILISIQKFNKSRIFNISVSSTLHLPLFMPT